MRKWIYRFLAIVLTVFYPISFLLALIVGFCDEGIKGVKNYAKDNTPTEWLKDLKRNW